MPRRIVINTPTFSERSFIAAARNERESFTHSTGYNRAIRAADNFQNRRFGIEIEAFGLERNSIADLLNRNGILCYVENYNHATRNHWKVVTDSSIVFDRQTIPGESFELVSPPLSGVEGIEQVVKVVNLIRNAGGRVNNTCGIHIHVDMTDSLTLSVAQVISNRFAVWEKHLDLFFDRTRRESRNRFCRGEDFELRPIESTLESTNHVRYPFVALNNQTRIDEYAWNQTILRRYGHSLYDLRNATLNTLNQYVNSDVVGNGGTNNIIRHMFNDRYRKINFSSYIQHGTIEFRQLEGTLDSEKISAWIDFCVAFIGESILLSASYLESGGYGSDTPSRYRYFLDMLRDHPFSGMSNQTSVEYMLKVIKRRSNPSFNILNQAINEKNNFAHTLQQRKKLYAKLCVVYPDIRAMVRHGYVGETVTSRDGVKFPKMFAALPERIGSDVFDKSIGDILADMTGSIIQTQVQQTIRPLSEPVAVPPNNSPTVAPTQNLNNQDLQYLLDRMRVQLTQNYTASHTSNSTWSQYINRTNGSTITW